MPLGVTRWKRGRMKRAVCTADSRLKLLMLGTRFSRKSGPEKESRRHAAALLWEI